MRHTLALFAMVLIASGADCADCLSIEQAGSKIGANGCVTGRVVKVSEGQTGNFYLNFCENYRECPFTIFVPRRSLRDVGDVRQLEGKVVEVHGKIQQYEGRTEIVLKEARQLRGDSAKIPAVPKDFDVQRKGHYSAGKYKAPKSPKQSSRTKKPAEKPAEEESQ